MHEISVELTFDAGHRIVGHKGKCAQLHGHTYKVHIQVSGELEDPGFVVDFGDIKDLVMEWDHKMLLWNSDPIFPTGLDDVERQLWEEDSGIMRLPFNPTAELMAENIADRIQSSFRIYSVMVELWETPKTMARYVI